MGAGPLGTKLMVSNMGQVPAIAELPKPVGSVVQQARFYILHGLERRNQ